MHACKGVRDMVRVCDGGCVLAIDVSVYVCVSVCVCIYIYIYLSVCMCHVRHVFMSLAASRMCCMIT
jgi:hypothetical protein